MINTAEEVYGGQVEGVVAGAALGRLEDRHTSTQLVQLLPDLLTLRLVLLDHPPVLLHSPVLLPEGPQQEVPHKGVLTAIAACL